MRSASTREGQPAQLMVHGGDRAPDGEGGFWIASEGVATALCRMRSIVSGQWRDPHRHRPAARNCLRSRRVFGLRGSDPRGWATCSISRCSVAWRDDPANHAKVLGYQHRNARLVGDPLPADRTATGWVGLSRIVAHGDFVYFVERDNQIAGAAVTKRITRVPLSAMEGMVALGETPAVLEPEVVVDLLPYLTSTGRLCARQGRGSGHRGGWHDVGLERQ